MDRVGVRLVRTKDGGYTLQACKPKPNAKRPARGEPKPIKKAKNRKSRTATPSVALVREDAESESGEGCESPRNGREKRHAAQTEAVAESPNAPAAVEENTPSEPPI